MFEWPFLYAVDSVATYLFCSLFSLETSRSVEILTLKVLTQPTLAMAELLLYSTVSIGWKVVHGMDAMDLWCVQTVRYDHLLWIFSFLH